MALVFLPRARVRYERKGMLAFRRVLPGVAVALLAACKAGPPPDLVRVELEELILSPHPTRPIVHVRRGGASKPLDEEAAFAVTPPDLATVSKDGTVSCQKSGDGQFTVNVQGVKGERKLRCRLVDRIEVGELPLLDVNGPPVELAARVLTKTGAELSDVPLVVSSQSPRLLSVSARRLTPLAVGETTITLRAGTREQKLPARIVKTLSPEALPLEGGRRIFLGTPDGKYEVEVSFPVEKTFAVEWRGAPYCAYKATGKTHRASCTLTGKGGAVIDNPAFLVNGSTEVSRAGISIREIP
jgi:hypothetical protein